MRCVATATGLEIEQKPKSSSEKVLRLFFLTEELILGEGERLKVDGGSLVGLLHQRMMNRIIINNTFLQAGVIISISICPEPASVVNYGDVRPPYGPPWAWVVGPSEHVPHTEMSINA